MIARRYGPKGSEAGDPEYERHAYWCRYHGRYVTYEAFLSLVRRGSMYGPPGCHSKSNIAARHRNWCHRNGWAPWNEYLAKRDPRGREADTFTRPASEIIAKILRKASS